MSYTADPAADALRYDDEMEAASEISEALSDSYRDDINEGFRTFSELPYVVYAAGRNKIKQQAFSEAVSDQIQDDKIFVELVKVLKTSECPKVKALLDSMAKHYAAYWLGDLVEAA
jgi:hypothetical protein